MSSLFELEPREVPVFWPFPKIGRLYKDMIVTEKIDGTNAAIGVTSEGAVYAQSRKTVITPERDNHGFANWVAEHADELRDGLGEGVHFGEWWGSGIQRGYDLPRGEKRFSLFNTGRWTSIFNSTLSARMAGAALDMMARLGLTDSEIHMCDECPVCHVVPVLVIRTFDTQRIQNVYKSLRAYGSVAAPGFPNPEGVVVFHTARGELFKLSDAKVPPKEFA